MSLSYVTELYSQGYFSKVYNYLTNDETSKILKEEDEFLHNLFLLKIYYIRSLLPEGIELIKKIEQEGDYNDNQEAILKAIKVRYLLRMSSNQDALKIIDHLGSKASAIDTSAYGIIGNFQAVVARLKTSYYENLGETSLAIYYANQAYFLSKDNYEDINTVGSFLTLIDLLIESGDIENAELRIEELQNIGELLNNKFYKVSALIAKTNLLSLKTELDKAKETVELAKEIARDLNSPVLNYRINVVEAVVYRYRSDLEKTREIHIQNLLVIDEIGSDLMRSSVFNNLGILENAAGNLDLSLDYYFRSLEILESMGITQGVGTSFNNISIIYLLKGELELALEYLEKSKEIAEQNGTQKSKATAYINIGQVYHIKGDLDAAEKYYLRCYEIDRQYENDIDVAEVLYNLIVLNVEKKDLDNAKEYLCSLEEINRKNDNKLINLRYRLSRVHILKSSKRSINQAKAQELLKEIVNEEPIDYELYVDSLLNLCEVLLIELKQTGEDEILDEIKHFVEILTTYATNQKSHSLLAEGYLIKSKIAELELDMVEAREMIEKAEQVSLDKGLDKLAMKISSYYDQLLEKLKSVDTITSKNTSLKDRLEEVQLEEVLLQMIDTKTENFQSENEIPTMVLVIQDGGNSIYSKKFQNDTEVNEDLIAGLFSALHSLSDQVFNTSSSTQRIRHEEYTIIMKPLENQMLFSYVFRGSSYNAMKKLDRLVESIKTSSTIWDALNREISHLTKREKEGMDIIVESIFEISRITN